MNKSLYKSSFKNITVSEKIIAELETKASACITTACPGKRKVSKLLLPLALLLAVSIITVSAAPALGLDTAFRGFFSQFFGSKISDKQLGIIEKYGYAPNKSYKRDGVELRIDGVIGDSNNLYVKYTISMAKGYDHYTHSAVASRKLYIGDLKKELQPASIVSYSLLEDPASATFDCATIYTFNKDLDTEGKNAIFVMTFPARYESTGIDLYKICSKYPEAGVDTKDKYNVPDSRLGIPLKTQYGKLLLESVAYSGDNLVLAVDTSNYYKIPAIYLRNKKTGKIYTRDDIFTSVNRHNLEIYPFNVGDENLKELDVVMPEEEYFSFPLQYTAKTRIYDLSRKNIIIKNTRLDKIKLSPITITFSGTVPAGHLPDFSSDDFSIRMKDKTVFESIKLREGRSGYESGNFTMSLQFEAPLEIEAADALRIKTANEDEIIEIPLNQSYSLR